LDAVTLVLDEWEGQVDFSDNTSNIESLDIWGLLVNGCILQGRPTANAAVVSDLEIWADTLLGIVIALGNRTGENGRGEEKSWNGRSEMHFD
jgi:hypothetical protein